MLKGKRVHLRKDVELNFGLGTSESEVDERSLFFYESSMNTESRICAVLDPTV